MYNLKFYVYVSIYYSKYFYRYSITHARGIVNREYFSKKSGGKMPPLFSPNERDQPALNPLFILLVSYKLLFKHPFLAYYSENN